MERRAPILPDHREPPLDAPAAMDERTVERLYGLSALHPAAEVHDQRAVADALRSVEPLA